MKHLREIFIGTNLLLALLFLGAERAHAETVERYSIAKTGNGFVRTDTKTGFTSLCTITQDLLVCRASIDEIQAFEATTQKLQDKISTLEKQIELDNQYSFDLKDNAEVDKALDMMEGFMERFFDMAKKLKPEAKTDL